MLSQDIVVNGFVQGVGFRPFVYRLATANHLSGYVRNQRGGVLIHASGHQANLEQFRQQLFYAPFFADLIQDIVINDVPLTNATEFVIAPSDHSGASLVRIPRDLATCPQCRHEISSSNDRRYAYPFTSCTTCGPRYSIVKSLPFDREHTSMLEFPLCIDCQREYESVADRRFHAQTNACSICGPQIQLRNPDGNLLVNASEAISQARQLLLDGKILALHGLGGFQLLCRADNEMVVQALRQRKHRPRKPFAVMIALDHLQQMDLDDKTRRDLLSPFNPILLLNNCKVSSLGLADSIAPDIDTVGIFLPTTPLHHLLLHQSAFAVVATSGNISDEPIATTLPEALSRLRGIADAFLVHNREVVRGLDDSVVRPIGHAKTVFRLGRGLAPLPLLNLENWLHQKLDQGLSLPPILATGGEQKVALAFWTDHQAILGQHLGDMHHPLSRKHFQIAVADAKCLYQFAPAVIACDMHPDYFTTHWSRNSTNVQTVQVQHHHAHALSCMVENNLLDDTVLAFTWDGTGYGTDGSIWGGEVLLTSLDSFRRVASLRPFLLPGGESAIAQPNHLALALWHETGEAMPSWLAKHLQLKSEKLALLQHMLRDQIRTVQTTSMGRLFDGVASLVFGLSEGHYEGYPAMRLENATMDDCSDAYELPLRHNHTTDAPEFLGDWRPIMPALMQDLANGVGHQLIATKFHNAIVQWAVQVFLATRINKVVLSGGCFQNKYLTEHLLASLQKQGAKVFVHQEIPPGDGGLAVGQLAFAANRFLKDQEQAKLCV